MPRHRLRDAVWASLHAKLAAIPGIWKADVAALRLFVEAVVYVLRTGLAGEDLPAGLNEPGTVFRRFRRWACKGIWDELFLEGLPADALGTVMLDSTACKAQRFASGARGGGEEAPGRSRGGPTTKIHAVVDGLGRPLFFPLTPGQAADCRQARSLLEGLAFERLIGDRGYDTDESATGSRTRRRGSDPVQAQPEGADPARSPSLPGAPQGREPVLPDQGLQTRSPCASARPRAATPASSASPSPASTSNPVRRP